MKLSKSQLREIIEDELRKDALQEDYEEEEGEEEDIEVEEEAPRIQERSGLEQSIEEMVREMFQGDLEERKKKRSVKSERRTRGRSVRQK